MVTILFWFFLATLVGAVSYAFAKHRTNNPPFVQKGVDTVDSVVGKVRNLVPKLHGNRPHTEVVD